MVKKSKNKDKIKPTLKSFNCRSCGSTVNIKILGNTINVTCSSCKAIIDANDPNFKILQEGTSKRTQEPEIPLNSRGKLFGVLWEVTGFLVKSDGPYYWTEYLLFNPYHGYRWLVEVDGHFAFYKRIHKSFAYNTYTKNISYKSNGYKIYNRGLAKVEYVEGEFFWRVKKGDTTEVADFINPPYGLSCEQKLGEVNWTLGHHVDQQRVIDAFKLKDGLLASAGVGALQPSPARARFQKYFKTLVASLAIIAIVQVLRMVHADNKLVHSDVIEYTRSISPNYKRGESNSYKSEVFSISGGKSNVKLWAKSKIRNAWIYLDALLVDAKTQKGIPISLEISYYRGYDWSEGSLDSSKFAYNVPDGDYYLNIKTRGGGSLRNSELITIKVYRDTIIYFNLIFSLVLIGILPLVTYLASFNFETQRWSNSDYSPYVHWDN